MKEINSPTEFISLEDTSKIATASSLQTRRSQIKKRVYTKRTDDKIRRWTADECKKYEEFIVQHSNVMCDSSIKRTEKIFLSMSQYIGTKTASQCRSHHQKFFKRVLAELGCGRDDSQLSTGSGCKSQHYGEETLLMKDHVGAESHDCNLFRLSNEPFFTEEELCNGLKTDFIDEWNPISQFNKGDKELDNDLIF